jgi:hypothetical protein
MKLNALRVSSNLSEDIKKKLRTNNLIVDCNIQTILHAFVELFKSKLLKASTCEVSKLSAKMISTMDISKAVSVDQKSMGILAKAVKSKQDHMDEDTNASSTNNVDKIATFLKLLLLFPNEYYEKSERPQVLYLATLIDIWSVSCISADPLARMKVSVMCRSLHLRFIGYFSVHSILVSLIDYCISVLISNCCLTIYRVWILECWIG